MKLSLFARLLIGTLLMSAMCGMVITALLAEFNLEDYGEARAYAEGHRSEGYWTEAQYRVELAEVERTWRETLMRGLLLGLGVGAVVCGGVWTVNRILQARRLSLNQ